MPLHQSIAEFILCHLKKRKNNMNSSPRIYVYKEFVDLNPLMQVDSFSFKRKMANSIQFKTIAT